MQLAELLPCKMCIILIYIYVALMRTYVWFKSVYLKTIRKHKR